VKAYYDARAPEYDNVWQGRGRYAHGDQPRWLEEVRLLSDLLASLPPARTLDVACGTGFLTRSLPGEVVGLDQSESMLTIARCRVPRASFVRGDALALPFEDGSFERVFSSFFYCHLPAGERERFLAEARRVAGELVVVASPLRDDRPAESWQERELDDGSRWHVYKRFFTPDGLLDELGGGETLLAAHSFVVVRSPSRR
jgi:ubiquinone/menaquinone biosynthesis C-methylase UbiE